MKITIENDNLIYIYLLKKTQKIGIVDITHPWVEGHLIYDVSGNWIGLRINLLGSDQDDITEFEFVDEYEYQVLIERHKESVSIRFDNGESEIGEIKEQDFHIDTVGNQVYGIEIIAWLSNDLKKRIIPKNMIEYEK